MCDPNLQLITPHVQSTHNIVKYLSWERYRHLLFCKSSNNGRVRIINDIVSLMKRKYRKYEEKGLLAYLNYYSCYAYPRSRTP